MALNGLEIDVSTHDAVSLMLGIASGDLTEEDVAEWINDRVDPDYLDT